MQQHIIIAYYAASIQRTNVLFLLKHNRATFPECGLNAIGSFEAAPYRRSPRHLPRFLNADYGLGVLAPFRPELRCTYIYSTSKNNTTVLTTLMQSASPKGNKKQAGTLLLTLYKVYGVYCYWFFLTIAWQQYMRAMDTTDTAKRPPSSQVISLAFGIAMKAGMPTMQPARCQVVIPSTLIAQGNTAKSSAATTNPATRKAFPGNEGGKVGDSGRPTTDSTSMSPFLA